MKKIYIISGERSGDLHASNLVSALKAQERSVQFRGMGGSYSKEAGVAVDVMDPKGERVFSLAEATKVPNIQFAMSGFYDIRRPNGRNELVAVNADRHESDLTPAPPETVSLWQNTANSPSATEGGTAAGEQKPLSLWWYVMLAVLALAVVESVLGNQHLSVDKEAA